MRNLSIVCYGMALAVLLLLQGCGGGSGNGKSESSASSSTASVSSVASSASSSSSSSASMSAAEIHLGAGNLPPDSGIAAASALGAEDFSPENTQASAELEEDNFSPL